MNLPFGSEKIIRTIAGKNKTVSYIENKDVTSQVKCSKDKIYYAYTIFLDECNEHSDDDDYSWVDESLGNCIIYCLKCDFVEKRIYDIEISKKSDKMDLPFDKSKIVRTITDKNKTVYEFENKDVTLQVHRSKDKYYVYFRPEIYDYIISMNDCKKCFYDDNYSYLNIDESLELDKCLIYCGTCNAIGKHVNAIEISKKSDTLPSESKISTLGIKNNNDKALLECIKTLISVTKLFDDSFNYNTLNYKGILERDVENYNQLILNTLSECKDISCIDSENNELKNKILQCYDLYLPRMEPT